MGGWIRASRWNLVHLHVTKIVCIIVLWAGFTKETTVWPVNRRLGPILRAIDCFCHAGREGADDALPHLQSVSAIHPNLTLTGVCNDQVTPAYTTLETHHDTAVIP